MCGIAGVLKWGGGEAPWVKGDLSALKRMAGELVHRGPDGEGFGWMSGRGKVVGLVHRRLAVIDLACGGQPMGNETGEVQVVFNGEIYNHVALRLELEGLGHVFRTDHSDTEVLVHGWEEWGVELPKKLVGMFAFGVWDFRNGAETLFLCRDRMGQKPLFYSVMEDGVVFGSTVGSVLAWGEVPRRVPKEQIGLYLLLGYFPGPQTVWRDVNQVVAGGWVRVRGEVLDGGVYWERGNEECGTLEGVEGVRAVVEEAVGSQLVSDVPVACFLSGGIDSSIVAGLMQREVLRRGGESIRTVSVGFRESGFDETEFARLVAEKIGSRHLRVEVDASQDVMGNLRMLMRRSLGQPFADSSLLATWHLSRAVREVAPVALSGDGADELFGGYDRYRGMMMLEKWGGGGRLMAKMMSRVGKGWGGERYRRFVAAGRAGILSERYTRMVEIFPLELAEELLGEGIMDWFPLPEEYGLEEDVRALRFCMARDEAEYLPGDVLWKVDSASMAEGLEVRSPFLDHRVVEMARGLAEGELVRGKVGKWILREAFAELLPPTVKGRGKKGFGLPIGEWFKGALRGELEGMLFAGDSFTSVHLKKAVAERMVREHVEGRRDHTHRLFALLMLEIWWREFRPVME